MVVVVPLYTGKPLTGIMLCAIVFYHSLCDSFIPNTVWAELLAWKSIMAGVSNSKWPCAIFTSTLSSLECVTETPV